ncbi:MAG: hypothetical protein Ta2F_18010 [Termitinemataceae bacterium]|nr:MAG: hypothetical protein Ta2F_18010 [Termitinemataceae bacterium]
MGVKVADKKPVYAPGELDKVKSRLGPINEKEAKRMQQILGGEIGVEKSVQQKEKLNGSGKGGSAGKGGGGGSSGAKKPKRIVELPPEDDETLESNKRKEEKYIKFPIAIASYSERVKMDILAGEGEYGIKTVWQVFISRISFFKPPPDKLSRWFVKDMINEYYDQFENIVTQTRLMFPRSNLELTTKLKKASLFAYNVLDTIRQIRLDTMTSEIGHVQLHPRDALANEFAYLLREIYKPIYLLQRLDVDNHIAEAYNTLYKIIFLDNPNSETEKFLSTIPSCLASWQYISIKIKRRLYPLLMKLISDQFYDYQTFFRENEEKISVFLGVEQSNQIIAPGGVPLGVEESEKEIKEVKEIKTESGDLDDIILNADSTNEALTEDRVKEAQEKDLNKILEDGVKEEKEKAALAEHKAVEHGVKILKTLFPKAGFEDLNELNDFYPYFADVVELKKNSELIAPEDPIQFALVLSQSVEELLYGFRAIKFKQNDDSKPLNSIIDDWHEALTESFERQYLPRVSEYAHYYEHPGQKTTPYISTLITDLHWIRRYYFLPYYDYKSPSPPSFKKSGVVALYPIVRHLRKELTDYAAAIDIANKSGGQEAGAHVDGILNAWEPYFFQVENPLSKRLNRLLGKSQRTNVSLMFFTLAIVTVLDNHLNNPQSNAYSKVVTKLFRSSDSDGRVPVLWVEKKTDTMELFNLALRARQK